ncbi:MAG: small multi-drug export protein [Candidatus Cloacimonetes bacterium]|nr:small multi-drug export protein [Candidatus Cloacimonadota bacterium]
MNRLLLIVLLLSVSGLLLANVSALSDTTNFKYRMITKLEAHNIPPEVIVFVISMLPIVELRGAIPIGIQLLNLHWLTCFVVAIIGNMVPMFLMLPLLELFTRLFSRIPFLERLLNRIFDKTRSKSKVIRKYEEIGLILFVAIPLPGTGGWTGSMASFLFGLKYWTSLLCIFIGVVAAGIIVTILSLLGWIGALIAIIVISIAVIVPQLRKRGINGTV